MEAAVHLHQLPEVLPPLSALAVLAYLFQGFKSVTINGLIVNVGSTLTQGITLQLGAVSDQIKVAAASVALETTNGTVGTTVQVAQVLEMPLVDRNVFRLTNLSRSSKSRRNFAWRGSNKNLD